MILITVYNDFIVKIFTNLRLKQFIIMIFTWQRRSRHLQEMYTDAAYEIHDQHENMG